MGILKKIFRFFSGSSAREDSGPYLYFCVCDGRVIPARDLYAANSICRECQIRHTSVGRDGKVSAPQCCYYDVFGKRYYARSQMSIVTAEARENAWKRRMGIA